jgi:uncharacterized protein (TIGR02594 family)
MAATTKKQPAAAQADPVPLDTPFAPWMKFAQAEAGKKIHELPADDGFINQVRRSLQMNEQLNGMQQKIDSMTPSILRDPADVPGKYKLLDKPLRNAVPGLVGQMEAPKLAAANPEITKYFQGLKTDPSYDKKGKSYDIDSTTAGEWNAGVTAWCAAFVNWCLKQAGAPYLNYATAKSWLGFGQTVASPVYGCVTVIKPSQSTGSTTGHVAFYLRHKGNKIVLLGGNQRDEVRESEYPETWVQKDGYRWPTTMDDYLAVTAHTLLLGVKQELSNIFGPTK